MRFDRYLLRFDLRKAFNQITLSNTDSNKLLFLWFRNVEKGDFQITGYCNVRLSFGLICSPTLLMLGLYKILILDTVLDSEEIKKLKTCIYSLYYMDNCAVSTNDRLSLAWVYEQLESIFSPYGFQLQQFVTNNQNLQSSIDGNVDKDTASVTKLLGVQWDRTQDILSTLPLSLDSKASTKREILSTIASQFDIFGFNGPILNRSRLFLHSLQCNSKLGWDVKIPSEMLKDWHNIAKQANASPAVLIPRCVGQRDGRYHLVAYCDSSASIYGMVAYLVNVDTKEVNFVLAKNRIINRQLEGKSILSLELQGLAFAIEVMIDLYKELAGPKCFNPIKILGLHIFSDSQVALSWLFSFVIKLSKMQKRSVFVLNRIQHIEILCEQHPIHFAFVGGNENPADAITRPMSHQNLRQTNFYSCPDLCKDPDLLDCDQGDSLSFRVPNPFAENAGNMSILDTDVSNFSCHTEPENLGKIENVIAMDKFSSFYKLLSVSRKVICFIQKLKEKLKKRDPVKFAHLEVQKHNALAQAARMIIIRDQQIHFPEVFEYFKLRSKRRLDMPNIVGQLNVFVDKDGLLRVRSKCEKLERHREFPIILSKNSSLTNLIVSDLHRILSHAGIYSVLAEMRKRF